MEKKENSNGKWLDFEYFRENLRAMTESKGLLNKDLAFAIDSTPATISRYMTNMRDPDLEYVYRISRYFGVTMDFMLGVNDDDNTGMTADVRKFAELYARASESDQLVIQTILGKYEDMHP